MNLYAYVGNDPLNFTDPWGLVCRTSRTGEIVGTCRPDAPSPGGGFTGLIGGGPQFDMFGTRVEAAEDEIVVIGLRRNISQRIRRLLLQAANHAACSVEDTMFGAIGFPESVLQNASAPGNSTYTRLGSAGIVPVFGAGGQATLTRYTDRGSGSRTYVLGVGFSQGWATAIPPQSVDEFAARVLRGGAATSLTWGIANNPSPGPSPSAGADVRFGGHLRGPITVEGSWAGESWEAGAGFGLGASISGVTFGNVQSWVLYCE